MIKEWILAWARNREPDFIIGGKENPYLCRHFLIPRNRFFNVYVHEFLRSDEDRAHHCHPWMFRVSWMLRNSYIAHTIKNGGVHVAKLRDEGSVEFQWGASPHRVELLRVAETEHDLFHAKELPAQPCWTLFITGPVVREWGFHCQHGWVPWQDFTDARDSGAIGKGCDQ